MENQDQPKVDQKEETVDIDQQDDLSLDDFCTREEANAGRQMFLARPDGRATKKYLVVRGIDSDEYRRVHQRNMRNAIRIAAIKDDDERAKKIEQCQMDEIVSLVSGWNFDKPFNEHSLRDFLLRAPQISEEIDRFAGNRIRFFSSPPIK